MRTWIVVSDASRARIFESRGTLERLTLVGELAHPESRYKSGELGAKRHSTVTGATGIHGGLSQQTSPKETEAERFARLVATRIDEGATHNTFVRLVLVAPPHFLGLLRKRIGPAAQATLHITVDKDYTHVSAHELPTILAKSL